MHSSECRQVGTKKVDAPVINQFEEGMKPFGKAAGKKYKSKKTGDSEGKEEVTVWECVDGCPVKLLNGENSSKTEKVDAAKFFPQFQIPEAPFFYTGKATRREKNEGVVEKKTLPGFVQLKADLTEEQLELAYKTCDLLHPEKPDQGFDEKLIPESIKELFEPFTGDPVNSHPCLHPDAFVLTDRGYRPIGMIEVGNKVYAADGTFRTVSDVTRHPYTSPNLFEIHVKGTNLPVQASDNHPFLIWRPTRHKGRVTGGAVSWVRADEIQKGDYTMTPVLKEADSCSLPSDPELWFLFGLYLAEGVLQPAGHGNNKYPSYTLSKDEADLVDRIQAFFGSERVSIYDKPGTHAVQVMAFSPEHGALFETWGGRHSDKKALAPELWTLNRACQKAVLDGWLAGDGGSVRQHEQGKTISFNLAAHIRLLAESNGMRCRIARTEAVEGAGIGDRLFKTTKPCYQLDITKAEEKAGPRWVDYDGTRYAISYVDKVEAVPYRGDVVNLSVEGNPTFQTSVGMSHNTVKPVKLMEWLVSLVCPKDGVVVDPYCGSGTTCLAAVNKGIRFVGIEKDPEFFNIALKRLEPVKSAQEDKEFFKDTFDFMASLDME
jgi:hypothetical protein